VDLCLDINVLMNVAVDSQGADPKLRATVVEAQERNGRTQIVCGGGPISQLINRSTNAQQAADDLIESILDTLEGNTSEFFTFQDLDMTNGLVFDFTNPRLMTFDTGGDAFMDYLLVTGDVVRKPE
jgi:hypothetical protein